MCHSALQLIKLFFLYSVFLSAFPSPSLVFLSAIFFVATRHGFRDWTQALGSGSTESWPLDYQGAPLCPFLSSVITLPPLSAHTERPPLFFLFSTHCNCLTGPRKKIVHHQNTFLLQIKKKIKNWLTFWNLG